MTIMPNSKEEHLKAALRASMRVNGDLTKKEREKYVPLPHRLLMFDLIARCTLMVAAVSFCFLGWLVPTSLTARLLYAGGSSGSIALIVMTAVVIVGVLDILVNDFLPDSVRLEAAKRNRHRIYHLLALMYFVIAMVSFGNTFDIEDILGLHYLGTGLMAAWYSWASAIRASHV